MDNYQKELEMAIKSNSYDKVCDLIDNHKVNVIFKNDGGFSPLHIAVTELTLNLNDLKRYSTASLELQSANISDSKRIECSAIIDSCQASKNAYDILEKLLASGNELLDMQTTKGELSALHLVAMQGKTDMLEYLIKKGADLTLCDSNKNYPGGGLFLNYLPRYLSFPSFNNNFIEFNIPTPKISIDKSSDIHDNSDISDEIKWTDYPVDNTHTLHRTLLATILNTNSKIKNDKTLSKSFLTSVKFGFTDIVVYLLDVAKDPMYNFFNVYDFNEYLKTATSKGHYDIFKLLLEHARTKKIDIINTPTFINCFFDAINVNNPNIIKDLFEYVSSVSPKYNETFINSGSYIDILDAAIKNGNSSIVALLLTNATNLKQNFQNPIINRLFITDSISNAICQGHLSVTRSIFNTIKASNPQILKQLPFDEFILSALQNNKLHILSYLADFDAKNFDSRHSQDILKSFLLKDNFIFASQLLKAISNTNIIIFNNEADFSCCLKNVVCKNFTEMAQNIIKIAQNTKVPIINIQTLVTLMEYTELTHKPLMYNVLSQANPSNIDMTNISNVIKQQINNEKLGSINFILNIIKKDDLPTSKMSACFNDNILHALKLNRHNIAQFMVNFALKNSIPLNAKLLTAYVKHIALTGTSQEFGDLFVRAVKSNPNICNNHKLEIAINESRNKDSSQIANIFNFITSASNLNLSNAINILRNNPQFVHRKEFIEGIKIAQQALHNDDTQAENTDCISLKNIYNVFSKAISAVGIGAREADIPNTPDIHKKFVIACNLIKAVVDSDDNTVEKLLIDNPYLAITEEFEVALELSKQLSVPHPSSNNCSEVYRILMNEKRMNKNGIAPTKSLVFLPFKH